MTSVLSEFAGHASVAAKLGAAAQQPAPRDLSKEVYDLDYLKR